MMKTPIKAVILDMGGVLLQMGAETPRQRLSEQYRIPLDKIYWAIFDSPSAKAAGIGKITARQHWQNVGSELNIAQENLSEFLRQFWSTDDIDRPLIEFIQALRPSYRTGLLSNAWDNLRGLIDDYWQISGAFDDIVISADVGMAKPDARIYRLALDRLGVQPEAAVFIDDVAENILAARQVGLHAIQFRTRRQVLADLQQILTVNKGQLPDPALRLIGDLAPEPVVTFMDALELIRCQVGLEYRLEADNLLIAYPESTERAQVIIYKHASGSVLFCQQGLSPAIREQLKGIDFDSALRAPQNILQTLLPVCTCQTGGPYNAYYFASTPREEDYLLVSYHEGRYEVIQDGKPVCWAWSVRENEHCAEVAVETLPEYRRRGYARQATAAWAAAVMQTGRLAFYSHTDANLPSRLLVRSLGIVHFATSLTFE